MKSTRRIRVVDEKKRIVLPEDLMKICKINSNEIAVGSDGENIILRRLDDITDFKVDRVVNVGNQRRIAVPEVETKKVIVFALNGALIIEEYT